jgi:hypothetical protein
VIGVVVGVNRPGTAEWRPGVLVSYFGHSCFDRTSLEWVRGRSLNGKGHGTWTYLEGSMRGNAGRPMIGSLVSAGPWVADRRPGVLVARFGRSRDGRRAGLVRHGNEEGSDSRGSAQDGDDGRELHGDC